MNSAKQGWLKYNVACTFEINKQGGFWRKENLTFIYNCIEDLLLICKITTPTA